MLDNCVSSNHKANMASGVRLVAKSNGGTGTLQHPLSVSSGMIMGNGAQLVRSLSVNSPPLHYNIFFRAFFSSSVRLLSSRMAAHSPYAIMSKKSHVGDKCTYPFIHTRAQVTSVQEGAVLANGQL